MKKELLISVIFLLIGINASYSQSNGNVNMKVEEQQQAHYTGGDNAFYKYVYSHLAYPTCVKGKYINDNVSISFDVMPDSTLQNFVVLKDVECNIAQTIIDIIRPLKFAPSIQNGTKVKENVMYSFPIRIKN